MPSPTIASIVAVVRHAGQDGITAGKVAGATGVSVEAATKALGLQIEAGLMSSEELWDGELWLRTVYRMREGAK